MHCRAASPGFYVARGLVFGVSTCDPVDEYQVAPATATSDTVCDDVTQCEPGAQYTLQAATATSDAVCANCTVCDADTQVRRAGAGSCDGVSDSVCDFINVCLLQPCENGAACESFMGVNRTCNCTGTAFCGDSCQFELVDGVCNPSAATTSAATLFTFVGIAIAVLVLVVALVVVALRVRERVYKNIYRPDKAVREKRAVTDAWELDRELLTLGRVIGEGQFGKVSRGLLRRSQDASDTMAPAIDVAVKQLKGNANGTAEEDEFFKEMDLMKELGRHKHVLSLVGVCTLDDPILLVVEFAELGDLRNFVQSKRATARHGPLLNNTHFVDFGAQIASGMAFLEDHKVCAAGFLALVVWRLQKERRYLMPAT